MSWWTMRRVNSLLRLAVAGFAVLGLGAAASGAVTSSIDQHDFVVEGSTATELVRYMNNHAFEGDSGRAYANMHPTYELSLQTEQAGAMCRPTQVDVHIDLSLTLPVADTSEMTRGTRPLWNTFLAFARAHEYHHRTTYLGCAQGFVQRERAQSAPSCSELTEDIEAALNDMAQACEAKEQPFEHEQARILPNLSLFRMARLGR